MKNTTDNTALPKQEFTGKQKRFLGGFNEFERIARSYITRFLSLMIAILISSSGCKKDSFKESTNIKSPKNTIQEKMYHVQFNAGFSGTETEYRSFNGSVRPLLTLALKDQIHYLSYYVTKPDHPNVVVKRINQKYTDPNFGVINDTLPAGNYRIYFVGTTRHGHDVIPMAWSDLEPLEKRHLYITYAKNFTRPDSIGDNFLKKLDITLPGPISQDITLTRIVGKVKVVIQDPIPASVYRIETTFSSIPSAYDLFTDQGNGSGGSGWIPVVLSHDVSRTEVGKTGLTFGITSWPRTLNIDVTAFDAQNKLIFLRTVKDFHDVKANAMTTFKGRVFTTSGEFKATVDTAWDSRTILPFDNF